MKEAAMNVSGYRWVVLFVFSLINAVMQMQWLTFAPIAREARIFYGVSALQIDVLSMIFMGVFIVICIPASYIIDTFGIRFGVGFGALLIAIFSLLKGVQAQSYTMVVISQVGLAVAQPFILNATTKVASDWFPINERATAVGIATLAQFLGIIFVMIATPMLIAEMSDGAYQIKGVLITYGIISVICAALVPVFIKDRQKDPRGSTFKEEKFKVFEGFKHIFRQRDMRLILVLFFIGLGMFNAISTCIDQICQIKGLTIEQTGLVGGIMLIAGIIGAIILPILSDKLRKRKAFIIIGTVFMLPGLIGLTISESYLVLLFSSFIFGFFLLGAGAPIGFQYAAEVSHPAPESTSQGLILLTGQISGIIFIIGMNKLGMISSMMVFTGLSLVVVILSFIIRESPMIRAE